MGLDLCATSADAEVRTGWRLWRLRDGWLDSWVKGYRWQPGPNRAVCLGDCHAGTTPGVGCHCGLWALSDLVRAIEMARYGGGATAVMGLVGGWGTVAVHGAEGFRAEYADVRFLLLDDAWDPGLDRLTPDALRYVRRAIQRPRSKARAARRRAIVAAAARYGVPALPLGPAVHHGVLAEVGLSMDRLDELKAESFARGRTRERE